MTTEAWQCRGCAAVEDAVVVKINARLKQGSRVLEATFSKLLVMVVELKTAAAVKCAEG